MGGIVDISHGRTVKFTGIMPLHGISQFDTRHYGSDKVVTVGEHHVIENPMNVRIALTWSRKGVPVERDLRCTAVGIDGD